MTLGLDLSLTFSFFVIDNDCWRRRRVSGRSIDSEASFLESVLVTVDLCFVDEEDELAAVTVPLDLSFGFAEGLELPEGGLGDFRGGMV